MTPYSKKTLSLVVASALSITVFDVNSEILFKQRTISPPLITYNKTFNLNKTKLIKKVAVNPVLSTNEDPYNLINSASLNFEKPSKPRVSRVPSSATSYKYTKLKKVKPTPETKPDRIHPVLKKWLKNRDHDEEETLIISFKEDIKIPRFPNPNDNLSRDSEKNQLILKETRNMINDIKNQRRKTQKYLTETLHGRYGVAVLDNFWLVNSFVIKSTLGTVKELLSMDNVLYIEPETAGEIPPAKEVVDGRSNIVSDPYFNLGQTGGYIGLLDTGVRFSHTLFNSPSNIDFRYDCTDGVCNNVPDITDDCWNHGTKTAGIVTGNINLGNTFRGVTAITLDSFKVYSASCGFLNSTAVLKAFEKAIAIADRVIIAEMQGSGNFNSSISLAADAAFDAGAVIIAANGNNGSAAGTVNAPANAHKVLGIGNYDVATLVQVNSQSRGPTDDNRIKPDLQAPTNTKTSSNTSDTATSSFGGTSGATPYGASTAALMRNWLRGGSGSIDPGQVYSHMILAGQKVYPFNNTTGAGNIKMPTGGVGYWGKLNIANGMTVEIPININSGKTKFEGSLWWPESAGQTHNDIDLKLISPSGTVMDSSISISSVFERARVEGSLSTGTWKVRIRGYSVPTANQTVYWGARVR